MGRLYFVTALIAGIFAALVGRLWFLQILHGDELRDQAETNQRRKTRTVPPRGDILDRNGAVLVTNSARFAVYVTPSQLPKAPRSGTFGLDERARVLNRLGDILGMSVDTIQEAIKKNGGAASDPALVVTAVTQNVVARIAEHQDDLPGVMVQVEPIRRYPNKSVAAHLLGYTQPISADDLKDPAVRKRYRSTDYIGRSGIERQYDALLAGVPGGMFYEVDRRGRGRRTIRVDEPHPGATLRLTIDLAVQKAAEAALNGRKGAVVALEPSTGEIVALASAPSYDVNLWSMRPLPTTVYRQAIRPFATNNAIQAQLPPGSTMKIVTMAAGLATGKLTETTTVHCVGGLQFKGTARLGCTGFHGWTTLYPAFASSCNAFFGQLGIWVGQKNQTHWAQEFGLGAPSGIDLPGEQDGNVDGPRTQEAIYRHYGKEYPGWFPGDSANMAIGQGGMLVTPLQMAVVAAAIANRGLMVQPHLLRSAIAPDGSDRVLSRFEPERRRLNLNSRQLDMIQKAMYGVVYDARGTGHPAQLPGIEIRGKSGSAESRGKGSPTHAWFTCYAGRAGQAPALVVAVWIDAGGQHLHGGSHAAPVARKVIARYFGLVDHGALTGAPVRD